MVNIELKNAVKNVLDQLAAVMSQISEKDFKKPIDTLNNATVGQHIRHTLEFFTCLLDGYINGVVNYDKRNHDKGIETDKSQALTTLSGITSFIEKVDENHYFKLEVDYGIDMELTSSIATNFNRELAYNIEHAIHHMALIKIGIQAICPHVDMPANFGVANSTVKYNKSQSA